MSMKYLLFVLAFGFVFVSCGGIGIDLGDVGFVIDFIVMEEIVMEEELKEDKFICKSLFCIVEGEIGFVIVIVSYGSLLVCGCIIFGDFIFYGNIWCIGVNEVIIIIVSEEVMVEGEVLFVGIYVLFIIFNKEIWMVIFNKEVE